MTFFHLASILSRQVFAPALIVYSCIVFHTHQAKDIHNDYESLLYYKMSLCTQKQGGIWKQWKKPRTKARNLIKMGVPEDLAMQAGNTRRGHWFATHTVAINMAMTKEKLINSGFYDLATAYQSVHVNY